MALIRNYHLLLISGLLLSIFFPVKPAQALEHSDLNTNQQPSYVEGEVIVKYKSVRGATAARQVKARHAVKEAKQVEDFVLLQSSDGKNTVQMIAELQNDPAVEMVEPNYLRYIKTQTTPWGISDDGVQADTEISTNGYTGDGVVVAVIDSGVDYDHEDLDDSMWDAPGGICEVGGIIKACPNHGWDFASAGDAFDGYDGRDNDPMDGHGHGTHISGIIAAEDNSAGTIGVAPNAQIMAVRTFGDEGSATTIDVVAGINFAVANGADIINLSIGGYEYSATEHEAIDDAWAAGAVVIAAAGNESENQLSYPAAFENSIAVGAIQENSSDANPTEDMNMRLAYFSNYGYTDVVAPGREVYSTLPYDTYDSWDGTSMATPYVAGVAALVLESDSSLTPDQVKQILELTASDLGAIGRDQYYGSGLVQAVQATDGVYNGLVVSANYITDDGSYADAPTATYPEMVANSEDQIVIRARVSDSNGDFVSGQAVSFSTDLGALSTSSASTDSSGVAEVTLTASTSPGMATITADAGSYGEATIEVTMANVLLVSDDAGWYLGQNFSWYYYSALLDDDVRFMRWNTFRTAEDESYPTSEIMQDYDAVLWFTGEYWIEDEAQNEIADYLDVGGSFMTSGQDQLLRIYDASAGGNASDILYYNYFKAEYGEDLPTDSSVVTGSGVFDGLTMELTDYGYLYGLAPDWITVVDDGTEAGVYVSNEIAAASVDDYYQSIYLPFGVESVATRSSRAQLLNDVLFTFVGITGLAVQDETAATATISWDDYTMSGVSSYTVSYGTDSLAENIGTATADQNTVELTDLAPGTTYYVKVRVELAGGGATAYSQNQSFTTLGGVPTDLSTSDAAAKTITVSWKAPNQEADSYTIRYATDADFSKNTGSIKNITSTSKTVSDLLTSKKYYFKVKAIYAGGDSAYTDSVTKRTLPKKGKINKVKKIGDGVSLRCRKIPRITKMTARIYKKKNGKWKLVKTKKKTKGLTKSTVKIKVSGLAAGSYRAKVRGIYNKKKGAWSKYKKFSIK